jgi:hypothetical protein
VKPFVLALATIAVLALGGSSIAMPGNASFVDQAQDSGNTLATDTLSPPTGLSATGGASVALTWTATTDTYASGHRIFRASSSGGPYSEIAHVTPRTTTTYVDSPGSGTFYYVARAYFQNWESVNSSQVSATVIAGSNTGLLNCSANVALSGGDGNGFQTNAATACAHGGGFAFDDKSGSNSGTTCSDSGKDRHAYYNYGISLPAGSTISGIEVRLDSWTASIVGNPFVCVELTWNGGTSWTTAKMTPALTISEATYTLGAANDTWGHTWTTTELGNASFAVRITNVGPKDRDFSLDWAAVRVTYVAP